MNDTERHQWIDNDEGLYDWWKRSRQGMGTFIRENRGEIDRCISNVVEGQKSAHAHYLKYGR